MTPFKAVIRPSVSSKKRNDGETHPRHHHMSPYRTQVDNCLRFTLQEQRQERVRRQKQPLHVDLPSIPPIIHITLAHRFPYLHPPSIVDQNIHSSFSECLVHLLRSLPDALFIEHVEFYLHNLWRRVSCFRCSLEDLGLERVKR